MSFSAGLLEEAPASTPLSEEARHSQGLFSAPQCEDGLVLEQRQNCQQAQ